MVTRSQFWSRAELLTLLALMLVMVALSIALSVVAMPLMLLLGVMKTATDSMHSRIKHLGAVHAVALARRWK